MSENKNTKTNNKKFKKMIWILFISYLVAFLCGMVGVIIDEIDSRKHICVNNVKKIRDLCDMICSVLGFILIFIWFFVWLFDCSTWFVNILVIPTSILAIRHVQH